MHESEKGKWSRSVMSDSSQPHGLQPTRLLRPWDFPGKSTRVGCHCLLCWGTLVTLKLWCISDPKEKGEKLTPPHSLPKPLAVPAWVRTGAGMSQSVPGPFHTFLGSQTCPMDHRTWAYLLLSSSYASFSFNSWFTEVQERMMMGQVKGGTREVLRVGATWTHQERPRWARNGLIC